MQEDTTAELLFPFAKLVADLSQLITLEEGDIILTGTPAGASVVQPGDIVEVEVDARDDERTADEHDHAGHGAADRRRRTAEGRRPAAGGCVGTARRACGHPHRHLKAKINSVGTATLSSQLRKRGFNNMSIDGLSSTKPGMRLVGLARTLRFVPNREDLFAAHGGGYNAQKRAFER